MFLDEGDADGRGVGVGGDEVFVQAWVEQPRGVRVGGAAFEQGLADAHHPAAAHLVLRGFVVEDAAGAPRPGHPFDADQPEVGVHGDHGEPGTE